MSAELATMTTVGAQAPAPRNPANVYLASLRSGASRRRMAGALQTLAELATGGRVQADALPWHGLTYAETQALRTQLAERYAPATANLLLSALRGVLREAWRLGLMDAERYQRAADLRNVRGSTLPAGRSLGEGELAALFRVCQGSLAALRDAALLALLYGCGLRRSEAVGLDLADWDRVEGTLRVRRAKGGQERLAHVVGGARAALERWLGVRGDWNGPLFAPCPRGGGIERRGITAHAVLLICRRRGRQAGLDAFSPHDLRRSFVSDLLDAGADLAAVQRLAGHAQPQTTSRYDRRGERAKRKAASLLDVPIASE